ncbi:putative glucan 4-alpha-glucosidase protein [Botrytis fragariae]|uniref:Putative glucan 4-alpha-glucosidase protein n=1 Tax=Botrytis fragariae TaxID=1964551 RepID=A0A8H6AZ89_9HELO|nr:putative glucan 4-alpha-glucosidase protein [Botrytis fragariae]KAF5876145.1 putative glucan 4-alpha-glucosidase protein [Botrytis fragariae]
MDMDDPWGSPWADELNNDDGLGIRSIDNVADGNQVGKASEALRNNVNATWDTSDDGFGDWEEDTGKKKGGLGLDGAAEQWDTPSRGRELEVVKDDVGALSPGWGNSSPSPARAAPKLSPSLLAEPVAIVREPSPDPWANAVHSEESAKVEDKPNSGATTTNLDTFQKAIAEATDEDSEVESPEAFEAIVPQPEDSDETKFEPVELLSDETAQPVIGGMNTDNEEAIGLGIDLEPESDLCTEIIEDEHHESDDTVLPSTQVPEHESSRPSSSPSDISHHDGLLPDSPRTSLDEEPKRSRTIRAVSPDVQEPAKEFDDPAKQKDELVAEDARLEEETDGSTELDNEHASVTKSEVLEDDGIEEFSNAEEPEVPEDEEEIEQSSKAEEPDDDDFGDFGDFEEGFSDDGEEVMENHNSIEQPISSELATPQNESSKMRSPKRPTGPVDFSIDLTSMKTLFGEAKEEHDEVAERIFIPDTIIADTFASTEERKMWYRVSRYGTMRKHNTGDDENYVRISWAPSQVKQETQKIVARWMEEDRNDGHVGFGDTSKGGSLFGWNDPNAPPVPLATVLGSKRKSVKLEAKVAAKEPVDTPRKSSKEVTRDQSRFKSRSPSKPRERSSTNSVDSGVDVKAPPPPPVAQFGWASSPAMQTASGSGITPPDTGSFMKTFTLPMNSTLGSFGQLSPALPSPAPKSPIEPPPSFVQAVKKPRPISMPPPSTNSSNGKPANLAFISNDSDDDENDDEWGEMVSSPIVTEAPKFPTRGLRHKKSMSLGDTLANSITLPNPQVTKLQSGFGLNPKSRLEQIPGSKSPIALRSPQLSGTIPSPISSNPSFLDLWSTPATTPVPIQSTALPPPSPALSATAFSDHSPQPILSSPLNTTFTDTWSQPPPFSTSVSAPPITSNWSQPSSPSMPPPSTSMQDPWASVDFSFFDAPTPAPAIATGPAPMLLSKQTTKPRPQSYPAPPKPKTVTFSTPSPKSILSPPVPTYANHDSKTKFEMEQDEIVKRIVGGLPNLGYMLKR